MYDIVLIANPNARKGKAQKKLDYIINYFKQSGYEIAPFYTKKAFDAIEIAKRVVDEGCNIVIAAGGDGTVNECADGIMRASKKAKLGIIPIGRGNDFAFVANIPLDIKQACDLIISQKSKKTDVGIVKGGNFPQGRYFLNGVGIGFEPTVNFKASSYKHLNGMPSYVAAFFYVLIHTPKPIKTKLEFEGQERIIETQQISICNGRRMGSSFIMAPHGVIDDGKIDLIFTNAPVSGLEMFSCALDFFKGKQLRRKKFEEYKVTEVNIEGESSFPLHADGEVISYSTNKCSIKLLPGAIEIFRE